MLRARASAGLVRDGHGDLRAEHVLLAPTLQIVDCVEFDPGLRALDVADDLAFLVFDLVARGAERLAASLVAAYRQAGGDAGDDSLIAFYACYRALVRAKVALIRAGQLTDAGKQQRGRKEGWSLIEVAERFAWRARLPLVIVVCGVPASGKSSLAQAVANQSGLAHLSSDVVRKELARIAPTDRAPHTVYSTEWNARTYAELGRRAARAVARDRGVIVDATFRCRADRDSFSAAFESSAPLLFVECRAPLSVLSARGSAREHGQPFVSTPAWRSCCASTRRGSRSTSCLPTRTSCFGPIGSCSRRSAISWRCSIADWRRGSGYVVFRSDRSDWRGWRAQIPLRSVPRMNSTPENRFRVLIAGGGVAALEAALALRDLAGDRIATTVLSPQLTSSIGPCGCASRSPTAGRSSIRWRTSRATSASSYKQDAFKWLDPAKRTVHTGTGGEALEYDALLLAMGAAQRPALSHAETLDDSQARRAAARADPGRRGRVRPQARVRGSQPDAVAASDLRAGADDRAASV